MDPILASTTGASILLLFGVLGYFMRVLHQDIRTTISDQGKLKGKIELLESENKGKFDLIQHQTQSEIKSTQQEIRAMAKSVCTLSSGLNVLSTDISKLLLYLAKNNIEIPEGEKKDIDTLK